MGIMVNENLRITRGVYSFDVEERKIYKNELDGGTSTRWEKVGYYSSLEKAIKKCFYLDLDYKKNYNLKLILDNLEKNFKKFAKKMKIENEVPVPLEPKL